MSREKIQAVGVETARRSRTLMLLFFMGVSVTACGPEEDESDALVIGALLPFTGPRTSVASNLEQAAIMAANQVNEGGGINGRALRILTRDTRSDPAMATDAFRELARAGALAVIGPEGVTESRAVFEVAEVERVAFASPFIAAADQEPGDGYAWWRFAPSPFVLGEAIAKRLTQAGEVELSLVAGSDEYSQAFAEGVRSRFASLHGTVTYDVTLSSGGEGLRRRVDELAVGQGKVVVLSADVATSASYVNEVSLARPEHQLNWWLSPLLQTQEFVRNVLPGAVDGAQGVTPGVYDKVKQAFDDAYSERWGGDAPMQGAYYYYDSVALLALAIQTALVLEEQEGTEARPNLANIMLGMTRSTTATGTQFGWNEVGAAVERTRDGSRAFYQGVTGSISWDPVGTRRAYLFDWWSVEEGEILLGD